MTITFGSIPQMAKNNKVNKHIRKTFASRQIDFQSTQLLKIDTVSFSGKQPSFKSIIDTERLSLPLDQAKTTEDFVNKMKETIKGSQWVKINNIRLTDIAALFKEPPNLLDWKGYISDEAFNAVPPDLNRAMFELAINIANQSGFIIEEPEGKAKKWEIGGSGAKAMVDVISKIREENILPGINLKNPSEVSEKISPLLKDVPFKEDRIAIFKEFAQSGAYKKIENILNQAKTGSNSYCFTFDSVKKLAEAFPKSFGNDPFYKKASLVMIAMAGFSRPRGIDIQLDVPVASDYRLPQTLEGLGILHFNDDLNNALQEGKIFHEDHPAVQHIRAASVVASAEISKQTGFDSAMIDGLLWGMARKLSKLEPAPGTTKYDPKPHIMVSTMRF